MTDQKFLQMRDLAEAGKIQFKERVIGMPEYSSPQDIYQNHNQNMFASNLFY